MVFLVGLTDSFHIQKHFNMNQVFQQDLNTKELQPGGPLLINLLFKEPVELPDTQRVADVCRKHFGNVECREGDDKSVFITALDHMVEFEDGKAPVQFLMTSCMDFDGKTVDDFTRSQMWDCQESRDRILEECRYSMLATDFLARGLSSLERANLEMDYLEALAELFPSCEAFFFSGSGKLFEAEEIRSNQIEGPDRFIRYAVNVRFFTIQGSDDMQVDTLGMNTLFLPDLQYHFRGLDPNWIVNHAYNVASYLLTSGNEIDSGETIDGIKDGDMDRSIQWKCQYEDALIQPKRPVLDINTGEYAAGNRE